MIGSEGGLVFYFLTVSILSVLLFVLGRSRYGEKNRKNSMASTALMGTSKKGPPPKLPIGVLELIMASLRPTTNYAHMFAKIGQQESLHWIQLNWAKLRILIVNDLELAKELFQSPVFSARPENGVWKYHAQGNYGIVTSSGKVWEEQRRFTLRKLKDAGVGNNSMEALIATEVDDFIQALEADVGKVISPNKRTSGPILNTLWVILTGQRFNHDEKELAGMLLTIYKAFMKIFKVPQIFLTATQKDFPLPDYFPMLPNWLPLVGTMNQIQAGFDNLRVFCTQLIKDRQNSVGRTDIPESFIDDYVKEIEATTNEKSTFYKEEGVLNLIATIGDLFVAAGDTTANVLLWSMLHLIRNPDVQLKIQEELDRVVGRERRPALADRPNCPYSTAFLLETLRVTPVSIFSLPHMTTEDVDIGQYFVEKETTVILNIAAIHYNPTIWGDPENFRPERFLSADEQTVIKNPAMVAFSLGKRKCPGDTLAMQNLFLFVTAICQKFTLKKDPKLDTFPPLTAEMSALHSPRPFSMLVEERE